MYHGAHTQFAKHLSLCLTDDLEAAQAYMSRGELAILDLDLTGLDVEDVDGYDRDEDDAVGDRGDYTGSADVIVYDDEDERGHQHRTWRLMTDRALAALTVHGVIPAAWVEVLDDAGVSTDEWATIVGTWTEAGADADDYEDHDGELADYQTEA